MELYVSDEMMRDEYTGIPLSAFSTLSRLIDTKYEVFENIWTTISSMLNKIPMSVDKTKKKHRIVALATCDQTIRRIFNTSNTFLFCAYQSVESLILNEHKGSKLIGKRLTPSCAIMLVGRESNGLQWYISDRPFEDNVLNTIVIENKGSGYFEYIGPDAPIGADYYIHEFKEW